MKTYLVPNYSAFLRYRVVWTPAGKTPGYQPLGEVHEKLNIPRGSKVLFFAGAFGNWPHALAQGTEVHYTDISREMVKCAKRTFEGRDGVRSFRTTDAVKWPVNERYDYVASYEPYPLEERIPLIALRALAHSRGMRIIAAVNYPWKLGVKNPYEIKVRRRCLGSVASLIHGRAERPVRYYVTEFDSMPKAKRKAKLDLAVIAALQHREATNLVDLQKRLAVSGHRTSKRGLERSLTRIHTLAKSIKTSGLVKEVAIERD